MKRFLFGTSAVFAGLVLWASPAFAATLSVSVDKSAATIGDTVNATLRIDSEGVVVNAAQATVQFPKDVLEMTNVDRNASVFGYWLEGPTIDNGNGRLTFTAGTGNGVSGASLTVFTMTFKVKGTGTASLSLTDGAVTASDGSGTNVLSAMRGAQVLSVPKNQIPTAPPIIPAPTQITRPAVPGTTEPEKPKLAVPLYADPQKWYNVNDRFLVRWDLPADVTDVATALTQNPTTVPAKSEGLFDNKFFPAPNDGVSYLHVRFKNNIGWGATTHYRLAVDTVPPKPFTVSVVGGPAEDFPNPTITFSTSDIVSNVTGYTVRVDTGEAVKAKTTKVELPKLFPGKHAVVVAALDQAGNLTESTLALDIKPIAAPAIEPLRSPVYAGEGGMSLHGTSALGTNVSLTIQSKAGAAIASQQAAMAPDGTWVSLFTQPLAEGSYTVSAVAEDARGAHSFPTIFVLEVNQRPILVIGGIQISALGLLGLFALALVVGLVVGARLQMLQRRRRGFRTLLVSRDITSTFAIVQKELEAARAEAASLRTGSKGVLSSIDRASDKLAKTEKYILDNVEELNS